MGNLFSQYWKEVLDEVVECEYGPRHVDEGFSSTPNPTNHGNGFTPKPRVLECDPRSPTDGIARTPIEISSASKGCRRETYESHQWKFQDEHTPSMSQGPKHNNFELDPRSPAEGLGFARTPIQLPDESANHEENDSFEDIKQVGLLGITPAIVEAYHVSDTPTDQEQIEKMPDSMPAVPDKIIEENGLKKETPGDERVSVGLPQEVTEAGVDSEPSADQETSEVVTTLTTTTKIDQLPSSTVEDVKKIEHNSSTMYSLDTPKSTDKVQHQIANKENDSIVKKRVLFRTPEMKAEVGIKPKVRTPLGTVGGTNSPMQMLRDKQSSLVNKSLSTRPPQFQQLNRTTID